MLQSAARPARQPNRKPHRLRMESVIVATLHYEQYSVRMGNLKKQERTAIEAVAKQLSATWEEGSGRPAAYMRVAGKQVAVDVTTFKRRGASQGNTAKPHLRFDQAATRVIERLKAALGKTVPDGMTAVVTITAPIRVPSRTAASLEGKIQTLLRRGWRGRDTKDTVHGNRIRIRILRGESARAASLIGFVHNSDSDPLLLLNMTRELLELPSAGAGTRASRAADDRWLVVVSAGGSSGLETYRYIYSQLRVATDYKKTVMAFGDGRVGMLAGR
jgi:hypothetical protein